MAHRDRHLPGGPSGQHHRRRAGWLCRLRGTKTCPGEDLLQTEIRCGHPTDRNLYPYRPLPSSPERRFSGCRAQSPQLCAHRRRFFAGKIRGSPWCLCGSSSPTLPGSPGSGSRGRHRMRRKGGSNWSFLEWSRTHRHGHLSQIRKCHRPSHDQSPAQSRARVRGYQSPPSR